MFHADIIRLTSNKTSLQWIKILAFENEPNIMVKKSLNLFIYVFYLFSVNPISCFCLQFLLLSEAQLLHTGANPCERPSVTTVHHSKNYFLPKLEEII